MQSAASMPKDVPWLYPPTSGKMSLVANILISEPLSKTTTPFSHNIQTPLRLGKVQNSCFTMHQLQKDNGSTIKGTGFSVSRNTTSMSSPGSPHVPNMPRSSGMTQQSRSLSMDRATSCSQTLMDSTTSHSTISTQPGQLIPHHQTRESDWEGSN